MRSVLSGERTKNTSNWLLWGLFPRLCAHRLLRVYRTRGIMVADLGVLRGAVE
jgi:hypothetical protein